MVSLVHEHGCRSWKFCLGFLWAAAHFNVLFAACPREGDEALGILVLENCKVGVTFALCTRSSDVFPTDMLQIFLFTYWTCFLSQYFLMILLQWIDSVIFHLHGSPNLCASRQEDNPCSVFLITRGWELGLGCDRGGQSNGILVSQILWCGGTCFGEPVSTVV